MSGLVITPDNPMIGNLLASHDVMALSIFIGDQKDGWLIISTFITEILICGLNCILQINEAPFSVLDKGDLQFYSLLRTLDSLSSELHCSGVGV